MDILRDKKSLTSKIDSIARRGAKLDDDIHQCACSCLYHASEHGDVTLATRLVDAMPKSGRRKALIHWFINFGKLKYTKADKFEVDPSKEYKLEEAVKKPFWKFKLEKDYDFDLDSFIASIKSRIRKAKEHGKWHEQDLHKLQETVAGLTVDV